MYDNKENAKSLMREKCGRLNSLLLGVDTTEGPVRWPVRMFRKVGGGCAWDRTVPPPLRTHPLLWVRILIRRRLEARILGGQRRGPRARGDLRWGRGRRWPGGRPFARRGSWRRWSPAPGGLPRDGDGECMVVGGSVQPPGWSGNPPLPSTSAHFPRVSPESQRTLQNFSLFSAIFYVCFSPRFDFRGFYLHFQQTKHDEQQTLLNSFPEQEFVITCP